MKRKPLVVSHAGRRMTLCLAGAALIAYAQREGLVNHVNFNRADVGMNMAQVEALFGEPGQDAMRKATAISG